MIDRNKIVQLLFLCAGTLFYLYNFNASMIVAATLSSLFPLLYFTDNYNSMIMKTGLIWITLLIIVLLYNDLLDPSYSSYLYYLVFINIICLVPTIDNSIIKILLIGLAFATPTFEFKNNKLITEQSISYDNWFLTMKTIILSLYYLNNENFRNNENIYNVMYCLLIPYIIGYNSNWLEIRAYSLGTLIFLDLINGKS